MFLKKGMNLFSVGLVLVTLLLSGCDSNDKPMKNNYYLSLSGESEHWEVDFYDIEIKPDTFKAGNGSLTMKNKTENSTDFFNLEVYAVIDNEDKLVQAKSVKGSELDITQMTTGATGGGTFLDDNGVPISLENVSDIYMNIEWQDKSKTMEEKIDLYNQEGFFN
ncbi:hypothetical protein CEH05_16605 [Halobacillus halophilus]|uniref:Lipoprotein n=1 Tax=Halobacillus halophilus (strain ATCC 35676 / DSM 2266 / JCM 20832 / KCTC 3685 / LMG 17431 / NBRC 102448 / NCIMB 2269) TaxID=866895 RepID=I0JRD4_HALH3|nr:hypothetical protein [Halobacillus halophilus]ASF40685.1 hypothetical protein CEH05_16605 [Halobacillus halophilus]CCG46704.1 hypothetical protein HBHAL_4363 [Halobacillus halophilus DSM 2266]